MTVDIAAILAIDGIATGAVYALVAIGTVLIFTVTRVIFIPFGDIAAFTALTLAALDAKQLPGTIGLVVVLACMACAMEVVSLARAGALRAVPQARPGLSRASPDRRRHRLADDALRSADAGQDRACAAADPADLAAARPDRLSPDRRRLGSPAADRLGRAPLRAGRAWPACSSAPRASGPSL